MLSSALMEKRIYYHDTDAGGVVYYANYLKYLEEARTEFLEQRGLNVSALRKAGFLYAVRKCALNYRLPARYGETIVCGARLKKVTAAQMIFEQTITNRETQQVLVEAEVSLVSLNEEFKPAPIPEEIKLKLGA